MPDVTTTDLNAQAQPAQGDDEVAASYIERTMQRLQIDAAALRLTGQDVALPMQAQDVTLAIAQDLDELHNDLDGAREIFAKWKNRYAGGQSAADLSMDKANSSIAKATDLATEVCRVDSLAHVLYQALDRLEDETAGGEVDRDALQLIPHLRNHAALLCERLDALVETSSIIADLMGRSMATVASEDEPEVS